METDKLEKRLAEIKEEPTWGDVRHQNNVEWMIETIEFFIRLSKEQLEEDKEQADYEYEEFSESLG